MTKQINLIINGKGGVGKSFFATNFVQYLKDYQIGHRAIDTDNENSTLKRFHPEAAFVDIDEVQQIDTLFPDSDTSRLVVVDCRAASTDVFLDYFDEVHLFEILEKLGASLTIVSPVNHEADSVEQVKIIAEALGSNCRYVIVRNEAHSEQFKLYDSSQIRDRIQTGLGGREIIMPKLYHWLVTGLHETNLSMTAAIAGSDFSLLDRQRLKNWQTNFYSQIDLVRDFLLPAAEQTKGAGKSKKKTATAAEQSGEKAP